MRTKITDNWEVELTNDRGDTLTLKGEWYADFFKEYDNKQLIIANVSNQRELLLAFAGWLYGNLDKEVEERIVDDYLKSK